MAEAAIEVKVSFDTERKVKAMHIQAALQLLDERIAAASAALAKDQSEADRLRKRLKEEAGPLSTQERIKLAFAALRKKGWVAHMSDQSHKWSELGDKPKVGFETFWWRGEPCDTDPNSMRHASPNDLTIWFSGTAAQGEEASRTLEYYGLVNMVGDHSITVYSRLKTCDTCHGSGWFYPKTGPRQDCQPCGGEGCVPSPTYKGMDA